MATIGCGGGATETPDATPVVPDAGGCLETGMGTPTGTGTPDGTLAGTKWAGLQITTARVASVNSIQVARIIYLYDVAPGATAGSYALTEHLCHLQIDDVNDLVNERVLPTFAPSVPAQSRSATLMSDGMGGFAFHVDKNIVTRGITLADKVNDALPTDQTDPRIGDWDMDGHPGMTLLLSGLLMGQAYVIQRDFTILDGKQLFADRIEGRIMWNTEQVYLDSVPKEIKTLNAVATPDPDASKHTFQWVKVGDTDDCAAVVAKQCTLFR